MYIVFVTKIKIIEVLYNQKIFVRSLILWVRIRIKTPNRNKSRCNNIQFTVFVYQESVSVLRKYLSNKYKLKYKFSSVQIMIQVYYQTLFNASIVILHNNISTLLTWCKEWRFFYNMQKMYAYFFVHLSSPTQ